MQRTQPSHLGELESGIMEVLWKNRTATVRDVVDRLATKRRLAYTTVMTVMNRLVEKGLLKRRADGASYTYAPTKLREAFMALASRQVIEQLLQSYGSIAVAEFLNRLDITDPALVKRLQQRFPRRR